MQRGVLYAERLCREVSFMQRCMSFMQRGVQRGFAERCPLCINPSKMSVFDARYCPLSGSGDSTEEH